jgi:hypothetical protein
LPSPSGREGTAAAELAAARNQRKPLAGGGAGQGDRQAERPLGKGPSSRYSLAPRGDCRRGLLHGWLRTLSVNASSLLVLVSVIRVKIQTPQGIQFRLFRKKYWTHNKLSTWVCTVKLYHDHQHLPGSPIEISLFVDKEYQ